jgi:putative hemolysin
MRCSTRFPSSLSTTEQSGVPTTTPSEFAEVSGVKPHPETMPKPAREPGTYRLRLAESQTDLEAALHLRFLVFNLELAEGLESAYRDGRDTDEFDGACDHLLVEHRSSGQVVGTYRLQTGQVAARNLGYYSAREFDFAPFEPIRDLLVELGRACIHKSHRSLEVLTLLWRGITGYALARNARYLIGCSSLTSQCQQEGSDMYWRLQEFLVPLALRTNPRSEFCFPITMPTLGMLRINPPRLLRAYLSIGAQICGAPAIDREFKTIDFLTLLDLTKLAPSARFRFLTNK